MASARRRIVVFDLGGVLLQWDPRFLYRKLFDGDEVAMERFLATVCTQEWNEHQDAGRSFANAVAELVPMHAHQRELIEAFGKRFGEMVPGAIEATVEVVAELRSRDVPLYALSNWSAETFHHAPEAFPEVFALFDAARQSDETVGDSELGPLLWRHSGMRHRRRMRDE